MALHDECASVVGDRDTERVWQRSAVVKFHGDLQRVALPKLTILDAADSNDVTHRSGVEVITYDFDLGARARHLSGGCPGPTRLASAHNSWTLVVRSTIQVFRPCPMSVRGSLRGAMTASSGHWSWAEVASPEAPWEWRVLHGWSSPALTSRELT
jgi:hypothetical protein